MSSPKNLLIVLLATTTLGGAWLAWRQRGELAELRATAVSTNERAELQKRLWDLEKLNRELRDQLAAERRPDGDPIADTAGERPARGGRGGERSGRGGPREPNAQLAALRELMVKPEIQAMVNLQQQSLLDSRYAPLFRSLNLPPEQIDRLKTLLADRANTLVDVLVAARDQGIDPRQNPETLRKLVADAQNEINTSIKGLIGEAGFSQLSNYEQTLPQRSVVNQLEQRLSYTNTPLTPAQSEQLVQILAKHSPTTATPGPAVPVAVPLDAAAGAGRGQGVFVGTPPGRGPGPDFGGALMSVLGPGSGGVAGVVAPGRPGGSAPVTPAAIAESQTVLLPAQVQALQQIQQQQQTQQQLRQIASETLGAAAPAAGATGAPRPPRKRPGGN